MFVIGSLLLVSCSILFFVHSFTVSVCLIKALIIINLVQQVKFIIIGTDTDSAVSAQTPHCPHRPQTSEV